MTALTFIQTGPLVSVQDGGRFGMLRHGVTASGPMDCNAFASAGALLGIDTKTGLEIAAGRTQFTVQGGPMHMAIMGPGFELRVNGKKKKKRKINMLHDADSVEIVSKGAPNASNFAYIRFDHEFEIPRVMESFSTNIMAHLGGFHGRSIKKGDVLQLTPAKLLTAGELRKPSKQSKKLEGPIRFIWGLHAEKFTSALRQNFTRHAFVVSRRMDRMGVKLEDPKGVFAEQKHLFLVSDAIVPGDIQILGDGIPVVLMRDHQPTGGYPRIGTIISADLSRFAQLIPGTKVTFTPVDIAHAHQILAGKQP